jgi:1,4-alpha-glucan branching enzyme
MPDYLDGELKDRVLRQAGRELMLAQSSDWPFMITNGDTQQYARRRLGDHLNRFHDLLNGLMNRQVDVKRLRAIEQMDAVFPKLDYQLFAPSTAELSRT